MPFTLTLTLASPASSSVCLVADHSCFDDFSLKSLDIFVILHLPQPLCEFPLTQPHRLPINVHLYEWFLISSLELTTHFCMPVCGFCGFIHFLQAAATVYALFFRSYGTVLL